MKGNTLEQYIIVGKLNSEILSEININLMTDEVIFTYERIEHVGEKRVQLFNEVRNILPSVIYNPDYIYKDWNRASKL